MARSGKTVLTAGLASLALRIAGLASTFLLGVILARVLGPTEFGIYGLVISVAAVVMMIALLGTPQLAVRELSVRSARGDWAGVKGLIGKFGAATLAASLALGALAIGATWLLDNDPQGRMLYVAQGAMIAILMVVTSLIAAELRGLGAMFKGQVIDIAVRPAAVFIVALALVLAGTQLRASDALWIQVGVAIMVAVISLFWIRSALPVEAHNVSASRDIPWLRAALPLGAVDVLRQLDGTYGMLIVGALASGVDLGIYRVALSCAVVVAMPVTILHIIQAPTVSRLHDFGHTEQLQRLLSTTSAALFAIVLPIVAASWLIGRPAIVLVFGAEYANAWLPLFLLCVGQLLFAFFGMGPILLAMCHGERALTRIYLAAVGLGAASAVPLIHAYGAAGAAAAQILSMTVIGFLSWRYGRRTLGVDVTFLPLLLRKRAD